MKTSLSSANGYPLSRKYGQCTIKRSTMGYASRPESDSVFTRQTDSTNIILHCWNDDNVVFDDDGKRNEIEQDIQRSTHATYSTGTHVPGPFAIIKSGWTFLNNVQVDTIERNVVYIDDRYD